jgi:hypothetical protein
MRVLEQLDITSWEGPFPDVLQERAIDALEHGRVLYCPHLGFALAEAERSFLSPVWRDGSRKNISYEPATERLGGTSVHGDEARILRAMMARYARQTHQFPTALLPSYTSALCQARTSFRPAEIEERPSSYKKDDRLLHTDAFPSRPSRGARILRIFTNVHPAGQDRLWRIGEPFEQMARQFLPRVRGPLPGAHALLAALRVTKARRTAYDHLMLQLHDRVKADSRYQEHAAQARVAFPPGSTWVAFTDQVLHAARVGAALARVLAPANPGAAARSPPAPLVSCLRFRLPTGSG